MMNPRTLIWGTLCSDANQISAWNTEAGSLEAALGQGDDKCCDFFCLMWEWVVVVYVCQFRVRVHSASPQWQLDRLQHVRHPCENTPFRKWMDVWILAAFIVVSFMLLLFSKTYIVLKIEYPHCFPVVLCIIIFNVTLHDSIFLKTGITQSHKYKRLYCQENVCRPLSSFK